MTEPKRPTTEITLLERSYSIACPPEEQDKLERAARYLDRAMQGIHSRGRVIDREKIAIMAALNIAHELLEALDDQRAGEENLNDLAARLDKALDAVPTR